MNRGEISMLRTVKPPEVTCIRIQTQQSIYALSGVMNKPQPKNTVERLDPDVLPYKYAPIARPHRHCYPKTISAPALWPRPAKSPAVSGGEMADRQILRSTTVAASDAEQTTDFDIGGPLEVGERCVAVSL